MVRWGMAAPDIPVPAPRPPQGRAPVPHAQQIERVNVHEWPGLREQAAALY